MRLHRTVLAAAVAVATLAPAAALAAGYGIYEQGAAVLGMAGAGTASVHDASAEFYNPAVLTRLEGRNFQLGGTWLSTHVSFAGTEPYPGYGVTESMKTGNFFPPTVYWTNHFAKKWAYGLGVNAPFGLGVDWENPDTFTGRTHVTKGLLRTINGNFSMAYAVRPNLSLGLGVDALFAGVELNQVMISPPLPGSSGATVNVARAHLEGGYASNYGWNAGALWMPKPDWKFGLAYRAPIDVDINDGTAKFTQIRTGNTALDSIVALSLPHDQGVATTLNFPSVLSLGAAWDPLPGWTWALDVTRTKWSAFKSLDFRFQKTPAADTSYVEDYEDSWRISVGAEHRLANSTYRFGYYYDGAAAPTQSVSPLLPDANRHGVTLGLGWKLGAKKAWNLDVYNLALFVENRSTDGKVQRSLNGIYKSYVNATGASLAYHW